MRVQRLRRLINRARRAMPKAVKRAPAKAGGRPAYLQGKLAGDGVDRAEEQDSNAIQRLHRASEANGPTPSADTPDSAKAAGDEVPVSDDLEQQITAQQGLGSPLPEALRQDMEQQLSCDLSAVRIHTDDQADQLARRLQARAFTVGNDIFFAAGEYAPDTEDGRRLLAHELTHVVQGESTPLPGGAARQIHRDWWGDWRGRISDWMVGDPCLTAFHESERWARNGPYPAAPQAIIGAGGRGGFDAQYLPDPDSGDGELDIEQGVAVEFKDTFVLSGGHVVPHPDLPAAAEATAKAATIDAIPDPAARLATLANYQWAAAEHAPWINRLEPLIEDSWGHQHEFFLNIPRWDWLGASVDVDLDIGERAKTATDHMYLETFKMPTGEYLGDVGTVHRVNPGGAHDPRDQRMSLSSTNLEGNPYELLKFTVHFATGSDVLSDDARRELDRFMRRFQSADAHAAHQEIRVDVIGHASAIGGEILNQDLSDRRIQSVVAYLRSKHFPNIDSRIHPDPRGEREADQGTPDRDEDRRVDLLVDGGERQIAALHEWGHAFGLGDEYPGTGRAVGSNAAHHDMAHAMTNASGDRLPGATVERTGGIMASGNDIRPRYYATFHHALQTVTGKSPWSLGLHKEKWEVGMECGEPSPPGDWNPPGETGDTRTV